MVTCYNIQSYGSSNTASLREVARGGHGGRAEADVDEEDEEDDNKRKQPLAAALSPAIAYASVACVCNLIV